MRKRLRLLLGLLVVAVSPANALCSVWTPDPDSFTPLSCLSFTPPCQQQLLARLSWLSQKSVLDIAGVQRSTWLRLLKTGTLNHLFAWLTLTPEQIA